MQRLVASVLLLGLASVRGLYEDQVGRVDWYRQHIGRATHVRFHSAGQQRLALVATEQGAGGPAHPRS